MLEFMINQYVERDGVEHKFFAGALGIFGHGIVSGFGQGLMQRPDFKYIVTRNEQGSVHIAAAYAKVKNRLGAFACVSSIGPGATNMVTGAAMATINRLPVLLISGDLFATRQVAPVLQQLESDTTQDISVNDCFKPVCRYWDRINRPEQLITSLPEVMRVLTSPADTGAVMLALPEDVQAEAFDFPEALFRKRVWRVARPRADKNALAEAAALLRQAKKPMIIAGGGTIYSEACDTLRLLAEKTGIPVAETFAGKGSLPYNHPLNLGAVGATGTPGAVAVSREADVVIGIGTRYSDFTTASKSAFQNPNVRFININITEFDAFKHAALAVTGDARVCLEELTDLVAGYEVDEAWRNQAAELNRVWDQQVSDICRPTGETPLSQLEVIETVNQTIGKEDMVLCAAGSLPGDLHKLWRTSHNKGFHLEYGYSTMGYECAAGMGAAMAFSKGQVWVMVGDGNYLMMCSEIVTAIQEGVKYNIILLNNNGFQSIGGLSESIGSQRFGTKYRYRNSETGQLDGEVIPVDYAQNARSLGAHVMEVNTLDELKAAICEAEQHPKVTVITIHTDLYKCGPDFSWWEVPIAEVTEIDSVREAYESYVENKKKQRYYL